MSHFDKKKLRDFNAQEFFTCQMTVNISKSKCTQKIPMNPGLDIDISIQKEMTHLGIYNFHSINWKDQIRKILYTLLTSEKLHLSMCLKNTIFG